MQTANLKTKLILLENKLPATLADNIFELDVSNNLKFRSNLLAPGEDAKILKRDLNPCGRILAILSLSVLFTEAF